MMMMIIDFVDFIQSDCFGGFFFSAHSYTIRRAAIRAVATATRIMSRAS